jgi:hypothetical protein
MNQNGLPAARARTWVVRRLVPVTRAGHPEIQAAGCWKAVLEEADGQDFHLR